MPEKYWLYMLDLDVSPNHLALLRGILRAMKDQNSSVASLYAYDLKRLSGLDLRTIRKSLRAMQGKVIGIEKGMKNKPQKIYLLGGNRCKPIH